MPRHQPPKTDAGTTLSNDVKNANANLAYLDQFQTFVAQHQARMAIIFLAMRRYVPDNAQTSAPQGIVDWASRHQVPLIDTTSAETPFSTQQITLDGIHFKAKGHRVAATYIEQHWLQLDPAAGSSAPH